MFHSFNAGGRAVAQERHTHTYKEIAPYLAKGLFLPLGDVWWSSGVTSRGAKAEP